MSRLLQRFLDATLLTVLAFFVFIAYLGAVHVLRLLITWTGELVARKRAK